MSLPRSTLLARPVIPASAANVRVVRGFGDLDDPVRLVVLLAEHIGTLVKGHQEEVTRCLDRRATWRARLSALRDLFAATRNLDHHYVAFLDPDALASTPNRASWEDRTLPWMLEQIRDEILRAIDDGGWLVGQLSPTRELTDKLDQIVDFETPVEAEPSLAGFSPDVRPVARWLIKTARISTERLADVIEDVRNPGAYLLRVAYDALPEGPREAARHLQVLRTPTKRNGSLGPFQWAATPTTGLEVAAEDVTYLENAGLLVRDDERFPDRITMPRRLRHIFALHAKALEEHVIRDIHDDIANASDFEQASTEDRIEIHHHAARAGDINMARQTAAYFGLELRALARECSVVRRDFETAAALFQQLVDDFDQTDAYAWEYLGFNLAMADSRNHAGPSRWERILKAYERAHDLAKSNPLYHGRLLGYRAELGYSVTKQVNSALARYAQLSDFGDYVSWFIKPVLDGFSRKHRFAEMNSVLERWRGLLDRSAPGIIERYAHLT